MTDTLRANFELLAVLKCLRTIKREWEKLKKVCTTKEAQDRIEDLLISTATEIRSIEHQLSATARENGL